MIPCSVFVVDAEDKQGAELWAVAEDGSGRGWFQRFESQGVAGERAYAIGLAARYVEPVTPLPTTTFQRFYKVFPKQPIDLGKLEADWIAGEPPSIPE